MLKHLRLNDKSVRECAPEADRDYQVFDTEVRGFSIRILRSGSRTFALDYRFAGRQRRMAIGRWPEWTVTAARERAKDMRREIDEGRDPLGERSQLREAPRFSDMIDRYLAEHVPHLAKTNASDQKSMLTKLVAPHWATKLVTEITPHDVAKLLNIIAKGRARPSKEKPNNRAHKLQGAKPTPIRANRVGEVLRKMFTLAIGWGWRTDNPASAFKKRIENERERFLSQEEIGKLAAALDAADDQRAAGISCSISRVLRSELGPNCSRRSLAISSRRCRIMSSDAEITARDCVNSRSAAMARASAAARAARKTAISEGVSDMAETYHRQEKYTNKTKGKRTSTCRDWPLRPAWIAPIYPFQKIAELRRRDLHRSPDLADRPDELPRLKPLQIKRHAHAIVPKHLDQITFAAPEAKHLAAMWVAPETLLNLQREAVHSAPQVGWATRDPDLGRWRKRDHARSRTCTRRISAIGSRVAPTANLRPLARGISTRSLMLAAGLSGGCRAAEFAASEATCTAMNCGRPSATR